MNQYSVLKSTLSGAYLLTEIRPLVVVVVVVVVVSWCGVWGTLIPACSVAQHILRSNRAAGEVDFANYCII